VEFFVEYSLVLSCFLGPLRFSALRYRFAAYVAFFPACKELSHLFTITVAEVRR